MNDDYMISFQNETKQTIEASYKKMTAVERSVADFFIGNKDDMDFSSKNISRVLYVSEATLSRFSQKCGYKGYREFIFSYERDLKFEQKKRGNRKGCRIVCASRTKFVPETVTGKFSDS